jgi:hypothetical protein
MEALEVLLLISVQEPVVVAAHVEVKKIEMEASAA